MGRSVSFEQVRIVVASGYSSHHLLTGFVRSRITNGINW
jgi:hypothetical protein